MAPLGRARRLDGLVDVQTWGWYLTGQDDSTIAGETRQAEFLHGHLDELADRHDAETALREVELGWARRRYGWSPS